jgi:hypothetical protein
VYCDGKAQLNSGSCKVIFDRSFADLISASNPATVTVSAMGECEGIYISSIDKEGFVVKESRSGQSNVAFTWIAVGTRVDADQVSSLPEDIMHKDFDNNMKGVMFNENNREKSATPIWWDGDKLRFDAIPESKNLNKKDEIKESMLLHESGGSDANALIKEQQNRMMQQESDPNAPVKNDWDNPDKHQKEPMKPAEENTSPNQK